MTGEISDSKSPVLGTPVDLFLPQFPMSAYMSVAVQPLNSSHRLWPTDMEPACLSQTAPLVNSIALLAVHKAFRWFPEPTYHHLFGQIRILFTINNLK